MEAGWSRASCLIASDLSLCFWTLLCRLRCVCSLSLPGGQQRARGARAQGCCLRSEPLRTSPHSVPVHCTAWGTPALPFGGLATSWQDPTELGCWLVGCFTPYASVANLVLLEEELCKSVVF